MNLVDVLLGAVGLLILAVFGSIYCVIAWIFTGEAFPND